MNLCAVDTAIALLTLPVLSSSLESFLAEAPPLLVTAAAETDCGFVRFFFTACFLIATESDLAASSMLEAKSWPCVPAAETLLLLTLLKLWLVKALASLTGLRFVVVAAAGRAIDGGCRVFPKVRI